MSTLADADRLAIDRVLAVVPELFALERAADRLHLGRHTLLHAGPPLRDPCAPCTPVLHSAMVAILLEGWADTADQARDMVRSGAIRLYPAQDFGCVLPLADVLSPSMWVQVVRDAAKKLHEFDDTVLQQVVLTIPDEWLSDPTTRSQLADFAKRRAKFVGDSIERKLFPQGELNL